MLSTEILCARDEKLIWERWVADCIMEPLLRSVNEQASRLPPIDMAVYMLNCIYDIYTCLSMY
ncbi:hypothetical protein NQ318_013663 [Aromia moschata]|uniref:Conserved Oligomeric Golgi complex subunit 6 C-terminal domain-containing protein n=1 Tax=Aromia moschata TaxID=1265417 RepID=A0AAV8Y0C7_9CUCU|nr:hypothetical protein NQ318_013663 [Aromia moschata]